MEIVYKMKKVGMFIGLFALFMSLSVLAYQMDSYSIKLLSPTAETTRIIIHGDTHAGYITADPVHTGFVEKFFEYDPDIIFHLGDVIHGQPPRNGDAIPEAQRWARFDEIAGDLVDNYPYYPTIGNHEIGLGVEDYYSYFAEEIPKNGDDIGSYYYVEHPLAVFIVLNVGNLNEPTGFDEQLVWLEDTLTQFDDKTYKFVFFHRASYTSGSRGSAFYARQFDPIMKEHEVDAVFMGHVHAYERFYIDGINYVVSGGSGGVPHSLNLYTSEEDFPAGSRKYYEETYNYLTMEMNRKYATVRVYYPNGESFDGFTIEKATINPRRLPDDIEIFIANVTPNIVPETVKVPTKKFINKLTSLRR